MPKVNIDFPLQIGARVTLAQKTAYEKLGGSEWLRKTLEDNVPKRATKIKQKKSI